MKIVIYTRVSTEKQEAENQEIQLTEWIDRNGHELVKVYTDVSSGKNTAADRKGLYSLMADLKKPRKGFDMVLFYALDRLSREGTVKTIQYLEMFKQYGVDFHSYVEPYISSLGDFSEPIISILSTLAKIEREKISGRTKAGLERARKNGVKLGRPKGLNKKSSEILRLKGEGLKIAHISREVGVSRGTIYNVLKAA